MQVVASAVAGAADISEGLSCCHGLTGRDDKRGHVGIAGGKPCAAVEQHLVAGAAYITYNLPGLYLLARSNADRLAVGVERLMN